MRIYFALAFSLVGALVSAADLNEIASFPDQQVTGVGVSTKSGRIFVNFPYWSDQRAERRCGRSGQPMGTRSSFAENAGNR